MRSVVASGNQLSPDQTPFQDISQGLRRLREEDLRAAPAACMADDLEELRRLGNSIDAEFARRLHRFDQGGGYGATPALSAQAWLRWKCNFSPAAAADRVQVSRQLADLPQAAQAFADGGFSYPHAAMIARTAEKLGDKMEAKAETILVDAAKKLDLSRLRAVTIHLRHHIDPDSVLKDAEESHQLRFLSLSQTLDGVFYLNGRLDSEGGAILQTALNAVSRPPAADDERTPRQRRADALVDVARRQLDGGQLPMAGGQKPHLVVTVDMATLSQQPGAPAAELEWAQPGAPAAELEWAQPLPAESARRIACDCSMTPVFQGAESHQVDAGRTSRVIPPAMRRALVARDKGCRFPGCDLPPAWTDGHHLQHWADGGPRLAWNLVLLCRRHHYRVHEEGWRLAWGAGGELIAEPP